MEKNGSQKLAENKPRSWKEQMTTMNDEDLKYIEPVALGLAASLEDSGAIYIMLIPAVVFGVLFLAIAIRASF